MPSSLGKTLVVALALASGFSGTVADDASSHHDVAYVRSLKHARRAHRADSEAGPSNLTKRGPTYSGRATYYAAGLGACGGYNSGSDFIVALNAAQYGNMGQRSSWCGRTIAITYNGNTQYAQVADACPSCPYGGLDMSEGLFKAFAPTSVGVFQMSWTAAGGSDSNGNGGNGGNGNGGNGNGGNGGGRSTRSSTPAYTPRPTPTSTYTPPPPSSTYTPPAPTTTSSRNRPASSSSSSTPSTTTSSDEPSSTSSSEAPEETPDSANNLDSFALIYQGLNQMVAAAS
ncbi:Barwin-like endoglucanase [Kalmanozyma brasiliensis GHG001]|uniref:B2-aldehyde-forming enzyme n=1 Tax=Kalmanozyma brasiliensis (strain GHG001) TaxID=1365824 RepID=V5E872_KALBG|nr:Barwin-like endoglucanase [Kalmanozyma brasiliensis GHG001]EST06516.1 Barwin-like endoglucanase [Kalmanozyma brasiliensis GHG001]